jgi:plastocyanin
MTGLRMVAALALAWLLPSSAAGAQNGSIWGAVAVPEAGITNVVVYLIPLGASDARVTKPLAVEMDQRDLRFVPRVVAVTPGSTVTFSNSDDVVHNVFHPVARGEGFDLGTWPRGERRDFRFENEGAYVILCHVHPEMAGYVVVVASPYRAVTDGRGRFRLDGVAPGRYLLRTWHRLLRPHEEVVTVIAGRPVRVTLSLDLGAAREPTAKP